MEKRRWYKFPVLVLLFIFAGVIFSSYADEHIKGDLIVFGDLNVSGNTTENEIYGGMWYQDHTGVELNFISQYKYYPLFFNTSTNLNGFSFKGGIGESSNLTAQISGVYLVNYMVSGDGQNNHEYYTSVFIEEEPQYNCENKHKMAAGGDIITQTGTCLIRLNEGERVSVRTADFSGTGTGKYYGGNLDLVRVGH